MNARDQYHYLRRLATLSPNGTNALPDTYADVADPLCGAVRARREHPHHTGERALAEPSALPAWYRRARVQNVWDGTTIPALEAYRQHYPYPRGAGSVGPWQVEAAADSQGYEDARCGRPANPLPHLRYHYLRGYEAGGLRRQYEMSRAAGFSVSP